MEEVRIFRTTLLSDKPRQLESLADSLGILQRGSAAHSVNTDQRPRYRLGVWLFRVVRKSGFSYFVTQVCDVECNKGWFIFQALKASSRKERKKTNILDLEAKSNRRLICFMSSEI